MICQHPAHHDRERQRDRQRQHPHARDERRRAGDAPKSVDGRAERAHTSAAQDSSASCSQSIHASDHFVAARGPFGSSVIELFV